MNRKITRSGRAIRSLLDLPIFLSALLLFLSGCVTVAPHQRAILADPTMQFDTPAGHEAPLRHAIDNREGSMGGHGVSGGGCGCN